MVQRDIVNQPNKCRISICFLELHVACSESKSQVSKLALYGFVPAHCPDLAGALQLLQLQLGSQAA